MAPRRCCVSLLLFCLYQSSYLSCLLPPRFYLRVPCLATFKLPLFVPENVGCEMSVCLPIPAERRAARRGAARSWVRNALWIQEPERPQTRRRLQLGEMVL